MLGDDRFDVEEINRIVFTTALVERACKVGWGINRVSTTSIYLHLHNPDYDCVKLLTNHGEATMDQVRLFKESHVYANNRAA